MLSLIEVTCPHCGAHGQIMLPPVGTIIVGPCPECQGLVVVFCGQVLALQKETMLHGTHAEKREHMLSVLTDFLRDRVTEMMSENSTEPETSSAPGEDAGNDLEHACEEYAPVEHALQHAQGTAPITEQELKTFANVELKLLDNNEYFKSIFG